MNVIVFLCICFVSLDAGHLLTIVFLGQNLKFEKGKNNFEKIHKLPFLCFVCLSTCVLVRRVLLCGVLFRPLLLFCLVSLCSHLNFVACFLFICAFLVMFCGVSKASYSSRGCPLRPTLRSTKGWYEKNRKPVGDARTCKFRRWHAAHPLVVSSSCLGFIFALSFVFVFVFVFLILFVFLFVVVFVCVFVFVFVFILWTQNKNNKNITLGASEAPKNGRAKRASGPKMPCNTHCCFGIAKVN